jgi:hypothetical protein
MPQFQASGLTPHDAAVLTALFDPESSPSSPITVSKTAPSLPHIPDSILADLQQRELKAIQPLHNKAPSISSIQSAISNLSLLITEHPNYAPAYLNRAQATRLLIGSEEANLFLPQNSELLSRTLSDLNQTITLTSSTSPLSPLQATLLSKAHTHRGYLLLKASQAAPKPTSSLPTELSGIRSDELEERASNDFFLAGQYDVNNDMARQLSVKTNPYANICGAIVKEAMRREIGSIRGDGGDFGARH